MEGDTTRRSKKTENIFF